MDKKSTQTVKEAERLPEPILIDTFPSLYDNLAEAISPDYPRATANEGNTVAVNMAASVHALTKLQCAFSHMGISTTEIDDF